jgi:hypothetical protein
MKWRSSLVYLLVLLLVGGYYYYFEVVQKTQKEAAAREAKKVFQFQTEQVAGLTIKPKDKEAVQLKKEEPWQIVEPIKTDADKSSVDDVLGALSRLESEREVAAAPDDLKPFGLHEPSLVVSFQTGEQKLELLVGDKNPVGDGSYAKTSDGTKVFLIAEGNRSALNKGLNELRRRQLFSFQLADVVAVRVAWREGSAISIERAADEKEWKVPGDPEIKIKQSKMDNVIEQIHWLRAQNFLENESKNLPAYGLEPPFATVTLRLKSGENAELHLAKKEQDEKQIAASSSQLPAVVQVAASILDDLPKELSVLQDRSLLGFKPDGIKEIKWSLGDSQGHAVQIDESRWGLKAGAGQPEAIQDSWRVRSFLWDLGDAEYQKKLAPAPPLTSQPYCRIELRNAEKSLLTLSWEKPPQEGRSPVPVWFRNEAETVAVNVEAELLRRVEVDLERLGDPEKVKNEK